MTDEAQQVLRCPRWFYKFDYIKTSLQFVCSTERESVREQIRAHNRIERRQEEMALSHFFSLHFFDKHKLTACRIIIKKDCGVPCQGACCRSVATLKSNWVVDSSDKNLLLFDVFRQSTAKKKTATTTQKSKINACMRANRIKWDHKRRGGTRKTSESVNLFSEEKI